MKVMKSHPHFSTVQSIYRRIEAKGYQVLLAGGCVRDGLIGVLPNDFDLATNANPDQIEALFEKTVAVGKAFGVIIVVENGIEIEVTSFRTDGNYSDGRRPSQVQFSTAEEDAKRRDFTINALFYDLTKEQVIDYVGGVADLNNKLIRAVGDPDLRFKEDHLRLLRAIRFIGQLGFQLEEQTLNAIKINISLVSQVSKERLHQELEKLLISHNRINALEKFQSLGFCEVLFPGQKLDLNHWFENENFSKIGGWFYFLNALWNHELSQKFDSLLKELKFSNNDRQNLVKMLSWRGQAENFNTKSIGELVEACFDENQFLALSTYSKLNFIAVQKMQLVQSQFEKFHGIKPEPKVKAKDLPPELKGAAISSALKLAYWAQLESKV